MKIIALDVGTKRIGVAKADSNVRVAVPYSAVEVDGNEFNKIASLARAWDIQSFVLGLPRNNSGEETKQSKYVRAFANELKKAIPDAKICFQDESLTSVEAEKRLKKRKKGYQKGDIDSEAAAIILQDFLEQHGGGKPTSKAAAARHKSVKGAKPPRTHHLATAIFVILLTLALGCGAAYAFYLYNIQAIYTDVDCEEEDATVEPCRKLTFTVHDGESIGEIALNLKNAGIIRNSIIFQLHYRLKYAADGTIKAGEYELNKSMDMDEIISRLVAGGNGQNVFSFTVLPGENIMDIKERLAGVGYDEAEIEAAFAADYSDNENFGWVFEGKPAEAGLEGYLYGETYEFFRADTVEIILKRMIKEMARVVEENDLKEKFAEHGLNLYQGITLASIVQKEANGEVDQARVAQVFYNRLAANMNLGSDVTVKYAVDLVDPDRTTYGNDNAAMLEIDSPYNTRKNTGLPYGPISNPGITALMATATPDGSVNDAIFFLTGDDGLMYYSNTEEGHRQNISDHCQTLCNVAL